MIIKLEACGWTKLIEANFKDIPPTVTVPIMRPVRYWVENYDENPMRTVRSEYTLFYYQDKDEQGIPTYTFRG